MMGEDDARRLDATGPLAGLDDRQRGLLASALLGASAGSGGGAAPVVAFLSLDSADPSLMSRADVARLLAHLQAHDPPALRRAYLALRDHPAMVATLGGVFAPARGESDTGRLGTAPMPGPGRGEEER